MNMIETSLVTDPGRRDDAGVPLRDALLQSRQRWRDLVAIAADMAFETDAAGRFMFLSPGMILGWDASDLLGRPSELLLADLGGGAVFSPFLATAPLRDRRVWLKRRDGEMCWLSISSVPLLDPGGQFAGVRGVGRDVSEQDGTEAAMARALRRCELIDHIVWHMRTEIFAPRMMGKALQALIGTLGGEGAMIIAVPDAADMAMAGAAEPAGNGSAAAGMSAMDIAAAGRSAEPLHEVGGDRPALRAMAIARLAGGEAGPLQLRSPNGDTGILCATPTRFGGCPGVLVWRGKGRREWDADDLSLLAAVVGTIRIVLEHGAIQAELAREARTDALTGLLNRRAFNEESIRRVDRLERDGLPATVMFVDLDNFKMLNDRGGHEAGDEGLKIVAELLRIATRPGDMVARLGGDEFAVWMDGMDDLAAAERADTLCRQVPAAMAKLLNGRSGTSVSIGVATRWPGSGLEALAVLRRADNAMYQAKQAGRGCWRVWRGEAGGAL